MPPSRDHARSTTRMGSIATRGKDEILYSMTESSKEEDRWKTSRSRRFEWTQRKIASSSMSSTGSSTTSTDESYLAVSNPLAPIPDGVRLVPGFVSHQDEVQLANEMDDDRYWKEGFDVRKRVQRFHLTSSSCSSSAETNDDKHAPTIEECRPKDDAPNFLLQLCDRLRAETGLVAQFASVEEIPIAAFRGMHKGEFASNHVVTTFETSPFIPEDETMDDVKGSNADSSLGRRRRCFVAYVPIGTSAIQHLNCPARRVASCWRLESPNHWFDVKIDRGSLFVRQGDSLQSWRSCFVSTFRDKDEHTNSVSACDTIRVIKFCALPDADPETSNPDDENDIFGYIPSATTDSQDRPHAPMPPLPDLLTIVITTSPIRSNPSTELLEKAMETFSLGGDDFATRCRKVIVCDGFRTKDEGNDESVTRKHANVKQAMRNGIVTRDQAERYRQFKDALKQLCDNATAPSPFCNASVVELDSRHGYGFALRHALRHCVTTPFVCVVQHDRTLMRPTPIQEIVQTMWNHPRVKYVGISMRSNLMYKDLFLSKYGRLYFDQLGDMIFRPPELLLDASHYGPHGDLAGSMRVTSEKVRDNLRSLAATYKTSRQYLDYTNWLEKQSSHDPAKQQLSLTPTLFWYDNVHIAETAHYRDFCFKPAYKMVARGGFVEDKLSPVLTRTVERLGLRDGHARFGCFLLDDHSGFFFTGHLDGGTYSPSPSETGSDDGTTT